MTESVFSLSKISDVTGYPAPVVATILFILGLLLVRKYWRSILIGTFLFSIVEGLWVALTSEQGFDIAIFGQTISSNLTSAAIIILGPYLVLLLVMNAGKHPYDDP